MTDTATMDLAAQWEAAISKWSAAEAALSAFEVQPPAPSKVAQSDRLATIADARLHDALATPAPNRQALLWKLGHLLQDDGDGQTLPWDRAQVAQTLADCALLLRN